MMGGKIEGEEPDSHWTHQSGVGGCGGSQSFWTYLTSQGEGWGQAGVVIWTRLNTPAVYGWLPTVT